MVSLIQLQMEASAEFSYTSKTANMLRSTPTGSLYEMDRQWHITLDRIALQLEGDVVLSWSRLVLSALSTDVWPYSPVLPRFTWEDCLSQHLYMLADISEAETPKKFVFYFVLIIEQMGYDFSKDRSFESTGKIYK